MEREKNTQISFRLTEELAREFKSLCALKGTSLQFILERAVKEFVAKEKEKPE
jgi:predicted transcriptional regulator